MKRLLFFLLVFLLTRATFAQDVITYISPGVTLGWNTDGSVSFTPKISLGISSIYSGIFANITYGWTVLLAKRFNDDQQSYTFLEGQAGHILLNGGYGVAFIKRNGKPETVPKINISAGAIYYLNYDLVLREGDNIGNIGLQVVLPIPIINSVRLNVGG
jgi:hypothetical protein